MSFCQTCGTSLPDGSPTCTACGATQGVAASGAAPGAMPGSNPRSYSRNNTRAAPLPAAGAGLTPNVAGALAYLVGAITGILFLVIDPFKADRFVRFHAFQSIFFNLAWIAFWIVWMIVGADAGRHLAWLVLHHPVAHQLADHGRWILHVGLPDVFRLPGQDFPIAGYRRPGGDARPASRPAATGQRL